MILKAFIFLNSVSWALFEEPVIVTTQNGRIQGQVKDTIQTGLKYYAFQGIPYAKPPLGELRFSSPEVPENWTGILNTTEDKNKCFQFEEGSEDCLYLNVFTPNLTESYPVMVWIHGGYFIKGDSFFTSCNPSHLVEENVVVVTLNYRLGIFGSFMSGDLEVPGNSGLKDILMALKWVQDNVGKFGGDSNNVVLFGQSSGAALIHYLLQSQAAEGLFHKMIVQSGTGLNPWALARGKMDAIYSIAELLKINRNDSRIMTEEFRRIEASTLSTASLVQEMLVMAMTNPLNGLLFAPGLEPKHQEAVLVGKSHENLASGTFNQIPCIYGFNSQEALFLYKFIDQIKLYLKTYILFPYRLVPASMNIKDSLIKNLIGHTILHHYFQNPLKPTEEEIIKFLSESQFVKSIHKAAQLHSHYAPAYLYRFSYEGSDLIGNMTGVEHGAELDYIWGNFKMSKEQLTVRKRLVKIWTGFAKTGNPSDSINMTWLPVDQNCYLDIGKDLALMKDPESEAVRFWSFLYDHFGTGPYDTY